MPKKRQTKQSPNDTRRRPYGQPRIRTTEAFEAATAGCLATRPSLAT